MIWLVGWLDLMAYQPLLVIVVSLKKIQSDTMVHKWKGTVNTVDE